MADRLRLTVAFVVSAFLISGLTAAHAADPGFCKQYARAALNQVRGGLANPRCAGGLQGARWSTDSRFTTSGVSALPLVPPIPSVILARII